MENAEDFLDRMTGLAGGTGGDFLDRIDRIFKIRGVLGICLSWFATFSSRRGFRNKKSEGKKQGIF
jgi:hypothetical protein